jgi:competence protein ComEA
VKRLLLALVVWFITFGFALAAVNINTATKEELMTVKGIGEKRAQEIIDYRKKNGTFKSVDDLEKVPGIGPGIMKQIRSQVTVTGKTTADKAPEKGKGTEAKTAQTPKGDAMKSTTATTKTAEKSRAEEKKAEKK